MKEILIEKYDFEKKTELEIITDTASVSKGRFECESDKIRLYNRLLTESAGNPSTPFEFVPVKLDLSLVPVSDRLNYTRFGFFKDESFYTNLRNCLMHSLPVQSTDVSDFLIIRGCVPVKVINHLVRHRMFAFNVESSRNKKYLKQVKFYNENLIMKFANKATLLIAKGLQKLGVKAEVCTMFLSDNRLVKFYMCGWKSDAYSWQNLFAVRGEKTGTMNITGKVVQEMKEIFANDLQG